MTETRTFGSIVMLSVVSALVYTAPSRRPLPQPTASIYSVAPSAQSRTTTTSADTPFVFRGGENLLMQACGANWATDATRSCVPGVRTLIVSVPDPYDSHLDWMYDADLEAVRRGVEATGYVIDRFDFPKPNDSVTVSGGHEFVRPGARVPRRAIQPGVMLFRPSQPPGDLLLVYVVGEVPTYGIHKEALRQALGERAQLLDRAKSSEVEIRMVMPAFSGSVPSVATALRNVKQPVFILSGSASDPGNKALLDRKDPPIRFWNTINNDATLDSVRDEHVLKPLLREGDAVAVLHESSTVYGAQGMTESRTRTSHRMLTIPFPVNIADYRAKYQKPVSEKGEDKLPAATDGDDRVRLDLQTQRRTQITPGTISDITPAATDLVMQEILNTLRRNRVRAVVLHATDVRDKLFLADLIRQELKDVQLITYESNVLFLRSEFGSALRGMIVLSSYPLILENQDWTNGERRERIAFPSDGAEGIYNAVLILLERPKLVLEYGRPFSNTKTFNGPPVWITTIGGQSALPVRAVDRSSALGLSVASEKRGDLREVSFVWAVLLLGLLCAAIYAAVIAGLTQRQLKRDAKQTWREGIGRQEIPPVYPDLFGFLSFVSVLVLIAPVAAVVSRYSNTALSSLIFYGVRVAALAWVVVLVLVAWPLIKGPNRVQLVKTTFAYIIDYGSVRYPRARKLLEIVSRATLLVVGVLLGLLAWRYVQDVGALSDEAFQLFAYRALQIDSGVSPLVPIMLMAAGMFTWCIWHRGRVRELREGTAFEEMVLQNDAVNDDVPGMTSLREAIKELRQRLVLVLPIRSGIVLAAILLISSVWVLYHFRPSVEQLVHVDAKRTFGQGAFDAMLQAAVVSIFCVGGWAVMRLIVVWKSLQRALVAAAETPLAWSFTSLPSAMRRSVKASLVNISNRQPLGAVANAQWRDLNAAAAAPDLKKHCADKTTAWWVAKQTSADQLAAGLTEVQKVLNEKWTAHRLGEPWSPKESMDSYTSGWPQNDATNEWRKRAEAFVAGQLVYYVEWAQGQLRRIAYFLLASLIISIAFVSSYPFQPQSIVKSLLAVLVAVAMGSVLYVTGQMNRDPVLSALAGSEPGVLNWNKDFTLNVVLYVVVPVLMLLSSEVPFIRNVVFSWAEPLIRSLAKF